MENREAARRPAGHEDLVLGDVVLPLDGPDDVENVAFIRALKGDLLVGWRGQVASNALERRSDHDDSLILRESGPLPHLEFRRVVGPCTVAKNDQRPGPAIRIGARHVQEIRAFGRFRLQFNDRRLTGQGFEGGAARRQHGERTDR